MNTLNSHLSTEDILHAARLERPCAHIQNCAACMEHYKLAIDYLSFDPEMFAASDVAANETPEYRLAAHTEEPASQLFRLRRTWYLDEEASIVRVVEDTQRETLTGFLISEQRTQGVRIRFEEMEAEFIPNEQGMFEIGPADTKVESMHINLLKTA